MTADDAPPTPSQTSGGTRPARPDSTHPLSPDGQQWWDGTSWQSVDVDPILPDPSPEPLASIAPASGPAQTLSPDGNWRWDGIAWQPVYQPVTPPAAVPVQPILVVAPQPLSPDGNWRWDGTVWQPVIPASAGTSAGVVAFKGAMTRLGDGIKKSLGTAAARLEQGQGSENQSQAANIGTVSPDGHWVWDGTQWQPSSR